MNEKSWKPIFIKGWGGTVPRPYVWPFSGNHGYQPLHDWCI